MGQVSREQALEVMAKAGTGVDWAELDSEVIKAIIYDPVGLGREQTRFFANRAKLQVVSTAGIIPPESGKIIIITVPVNESRDWKGAVSAAGHNTGRDWDIWKVGDQYPPVAGAVPRLQQIFLANFGKYTRSEGNLIWAKEQHLVPASPRSVFAIGEHCPYLNLAMDPMAVVSLVPCSFEGGGHACGVWWSGVVREAGLNLFGLGWRGDCWFAFVREFE